MAGACADAKAALAQNPDDKKAFGISQLSCNKDPLPKAELPKLAPPKPPDTPPPDDAGAGIDLRHSRGPRAAFNAIGANFGDKARAAGSNDKLVRLAAMKADGNYDGMKSTADEILKTQPDNQEALNSKALAQNRTKDYKGALATADQAIKVSTGNAAAHANKAYALGAMGNRNGMIEELKLAAELDPQFEAALEKAQAADSASLFDMPGEVVESKIQGSKAKEAGGINVGLIKWIVIGSLVLPLIGLVIFFVLRNTVLKTPPPKPATPWPGAPLNEKTDDKSSSRSP